MTVHEESRVQILETGQTVTVRADIHDRYVIDSDGKLFCSPFRYVVILSGLYV